jgi:hypothetical protein
MVDCWRCKDYREEKEIKYKKLGHPFGLLHKQETEKDLRRKNLMAYNEAI